MKQPCKVNCLSHTDKWTSQTIVVCVCACCNRSRVYPLSGILLFINLSLLSGNYGWLACAHNGAELDLLCREMLSVTLALSSEMLSLTSLTYDSSSEPCEGNRYTVAWVRAVEYDTNSNQEADSLTHTHSSTRTHVCTTIFVGPLHWLPLTSIPNPFHNSDPKHTHKRTHTHTNSQSSMLDTNSNQPADNFPLN